MARTHLAITVELVHGGHVGDLWPRPGRVLIAARATTFEQFASAIDDAFARWDPGHLHEFVLADGTVITPIMPERPLPRWGWGSIPDQYGRRWNDDDGSRRVPKAPDGLFDLPPILPGWGPDRPHRTAPAGRPPG